MALAKEVVNQAGAMREFEKPEVCEAIKVANANRWTVALSPTEWDEREARLKKEFEERSNAPVPGKEQQEEKIRIICCSASPKADFYYEHFLNEGNPALKESASQFNDALLDEQAKEIEKLTEENERLKDKVAVLYACKENNEKYNLKQIKRLGKEISKLNGIIHDKNAVLSDVAEELRLSKIREKNLTEVSQKYMKENEELREKVAEKTKLVEMIRNASKVYCDYGVAANEFIKELASLYVLANNKGIINDEMLERCKNYQTYGFPANCNRETKKEITGIARGKIKLVGVDIAEEGGDHSAIIAQCCKNIAISKDEAEIIERCTKNGTELHYSEKDGFTYTNMFGDEMPIICLRGMCQVFTDEEIKNMKK